MRIWKINPKKLCQQHLLGEHVESHMFVGCIRKRISLKGYIDNGLVEVHNLRKRHNELANEMLRRGMRHFSPLPHFRVFKAGSINVRTNKQDLAKRCSDCKRRLAINYPR